MKSKFKRYIGAGAAIVIGTIASVYIVVKPTPASAGITAHQWIVPAAQGGIANCNRNSSAVTKSQAIAQGNACSDFNRPCMIAADGDTIPVSAGAYAYLPSLGVNTSRFIACTVTHSNPVVYTCSDSGEASVTTTDPIFVISQGSGLKFTGRCFRFFTITLGEAGSSTAPPSNIQFDNLHFSSADLDGANFITFSNFNWGPAITCWAANDTRFAAYKRCRTTAQGAIWPESYYGDNNMEASWEGVAQMQFRTTAFGAVVHDVLFINGFVHDIQSRDAGGGSSASPSGLHVGCGQDQGSGHYNISFINVIAEHCAIDFWHNTNDNGWPSNWTFKNSFFGHTVDPYDNDPNRTTTGLTDPAEYCCHETGSNAVNIDWQARFDSTGNLTANNDIWVYNVFESGLRFRVHTAEASSDTVSCDNGVPTVAYAGTGTRAVCTFTNSKIVGNIMGKYSSIPFSASDKPAGLTADYNVWAGNSPFGSAEANKIQNQVFNDTTPFSSWILDTGPTEAWQPAISPVFSGSFGFLGWIPQNADGISVTDDLHGNARTFPTNAGPIGP